MRLLVSIEAERDQAYDKSYYSKLQGFIYSLLKGTSYEILHDGKGYKFFCFSNIFPSKDMKEGDIRKFIISSPDSNFISLLENRLNDKIGIGDMLFFFKGAKKVNPIIRPNCIVKTNTPIIIRIPGSRYEEYGITSYHKYVFWRPEHDFNAFLKQLSENIIKKYNEFHRTNIEEQHLFQQFVFDGSYPISLAIDSRNRTFIGSYWKYIFSGLSKDQQSLLKFALDCGFGELNSLGFGFVNVVKQ